MDDTIRKYSDASGLDETEAEQYRYWQSRPVHERLAEVVRLTEEYYAMKGEISPKLDKTVVRILRGGQDPDSD